MIERKPLPKSEGPSGWEHGRSCECPVCRVRYPMDERVTKEEAIKKMKEHSRSIIATETAKTWSHPFIVYSKKPYVIHKEIKAGKDVREYPGFAIDGSRRITWYGDAREGIGVTELSQSIVKMIGEEPYTEMPFIGVGKNAEHVTMNNLAIICAKLDIETDDCKEIYKWMYPQDFDKLKKINPNIVKE